MSKKIIAALGAVIVAIILLFYIVSLFHKDESNTTINNYFSALRTNDFAKAYAYTSEQFQGVTSITEFKTFVAQYPVLQHNTTVNIQKHEIHKNVTVVYLTLSSKNYTGVPIELQLVKVKGKWQINYIEILTPNTSIDKQAPAFDAKVLNEKTNTGLTNNRSVDVILMQTYDNKDAHFSIKYPNNWEYTYPDNGTILFSGKKGGDDYYSTVNIQIVNASDEDKTLDAKTAVEHFTDDLKKQFTDASFSDEGPFYVYTSSGEQLQGRTFTIVYTYKGDHFEQWQMVVYRPELAVFYALAYTAPPEIYNTYLPIAKAMVKSWVLY